MTIAKPIRYTVDAAAQTLGLSRRSMWRRVAEWNLTVIGDHADRGPGKPVYLLADEVEAAATEGVAGVRRLQSQRERRHAQKSR